MVRIGIIGMGNMGRGHADYLMKNKVENCTLTAICDLVCPSDPIYKNLKFFYDYKDMIDSGDVDAVIVATPHYAHTYIGIYAMEHGVHLISEKPISVHKKDCQRLIEAHKDTVFSAMFNQRTRPVYQKMKELIPSLGKIQRMTCICTGWFRTQAYYNSSSWRATWKGEGGGVLLNQCPHQLDIIQWLIGMPDSVFANVSLGKYHNIEVEDEVSALWTYENGAIGAFVGSTGEYPGNESLEISGERGKIVFEGNRLKIWQNEESALDYIRIHNEKPLKEAKAKTSANYMTVPKTEYKEIVFEESENFLCQHEAITQNFVNAIEYGEKLISPGEEGIKSVEIANAMIMSGLTGRKISLPMDANEYERLLESLKEKNR